MKKHGFTLVELLAVIAILAILVIVALPNVMKLFNRAKQNAFETEIKEVFKTAQQQWIADSMFKTEEKVYARTKSNNCTNKLDLTGRNELEYYIKLDKSGKVVAYYATDGSYQYSYSGTGLKIEDIKDVIQISKIEESDKITVTCDEAYAPSPAPTNSNDYLMVGTGGGMSEHFLRTPLEKTQIEKITFVRSKSGHTANGTDCFDATRGQTGAILSWINDQDNDGLYEVTIGADGDIFVNNAYAMFNQMSNLETIEGMRYVNTSQATNFRAMFYNCYKLVNVDLRYLDTSQATDFSYMFNQCYAMQSLDLSRWDTSKVTNMNSMFLKCESLSSLNVENWNTSQVTNMSNMFNGCSSLISLDLRRWDTSKVTDMSGLFYLDSGLTSINISTWDTSSVTSIGVMFDGCSNLTTLDLSSFDTHNVTTITKVWGGIFSNCTNLRTIYVNPEKWDLSNASANANTFKNSTNLVGGAGTTYDSEHYDSSYAHVDGGPSNPGYLTAKSN